MVDLLMPCEANSSPFTPLGFLERAATIYGNCRSVVYNNRVYTWSQTHQRCLKLASALSSLGISRRDVVSVVAPNIPAMYEMHFGVPMSGAILNTINIRLDVRTISVLLQHSEAKLVFVDYQSRSLIEEAVAALETKPILIIIEDEDEEGKVADRVSSPETHLTYSSFIEKGDPSFRWVRPETEWAPMILNYTSGTTSAPKGVVHCHRGLFSITMDSLLDWSVPRQSVYLWTLPMFHGNGWSYAWGIAAMGGTNICLRKFDAGTIDAAIAKHGVTHMCGAPVVLNMLANAPESVRKPLPHVVQIMTAGAPPSAAVIFRTEALGFSVSHGYGLTETAGLVVSCAWKGEWNRFPASEGARLKARQGVRTLGMAEVDVIDAETGASVKSDGETLGEIVLQSGCIMLGYLKDPEASWKCWVYDQSPTLVRIGEDLGYISVDTISIGMRLFGLKSKSKFMRVLAQSGQYHTNVEIGSVHSPYRKAMRNGWLYTGDVGVMHPDGYIEIKDRSKDVIISGGENKSSVEVESVLYQHPAVNEAAVVARPDEFWGESPCAFLSLKEEFRQEDKRPSHLEIIAFCRQRMPHYTVPKTVVFLSDLAMTSTGKVQKVVLRNMAKKLGPSTTPSIVSGM